MLLESVAYAESATSAAAPAGPLGPLGPLGSFLPIILIFIVFYFLLIRPQQKRQKEHASMLDSLKAGDMVLTSGGIYGTIVGVIDAQTFQIEIANGVKVKITKGGIAAKINPNADQQSPIQEKK